MIFFFGGGVGGWGGLIGELIEPWMIAALYILCDVIKFTNSLQTFLQAARLNWCNIPRVLNNLKDSLQAKIENPAHQEFIDTARKSSGGRYRLRSYAEFKLSDFQANFVKPVISNLISEIENAFDIPEDLLGFLAVDPQTITANATSLEVQFDIFKKIVAAKRLKYESKFILG